jgi:hypothetical protein
MATVSTLLNSCTMLAALAVFMGNKDSADIFNVGIPDSAAILSGQQLSPAKTREIMECDQYNPLERATFQPDLKVMSIRDTNPVMSTGSGGTLTLAMSSGSIGTVTVSGTATDFAGTAPGVIVNDIGGGYGAILRPVITGGSISSVTIVSGGYGYSSNATATIVSSLSAGEKYQRPVFRWTQYKSTARVYNHDIERARTMAAGNEQYFNAKVNDIYMDEQKEKAGLQAQRMAEDFIYGLPSNTGTTDAANGGGLWDAPYGVTYAINDGSTINSAVYAGVDRSLAANAYFRARVDATARVYTLVDLWQSMHLTWGLINNGGNVDAVFVGPALFAKWQKESLAYTQNVNTDPNVQLLVSKYGYKNLPLKFMNTYVFLEPRVAPNKVFGMNLKPWIIAFKAGHKWSIEGPFPQNAVEGGIDGKIFYVDTQVMLICESPYYGQIQYVSVS